MVMDIETTVSAGPCHSDQGEIGSTGLGYEHISVKALASSPRIEERDVGQIKKEAGTKAP
jgi:hypothetical protein